MLKAIVGTPDSSGMVKASVQSGPVIPDSFRIPVSPHVSQISAIQKPVSPYPVISDKKYRNEVALENARFDANERLRHNAKAHKLAELRMVCSKYLHPLVNGADRHGYVHKPVLLKKT